MDQRQFFAIVCITFVYSILFGRHCFECLYQVLLYQVFKNRNGANEWVFLSSRQILRLLHTHPGDEAEHTDSQRIPHQPIPIVHFLDTSMALQNLPRKTKRNDITGMFLHTVITIGNKTTWIAQMRFAMVLSISVKHMVKDTLQVR